MMPLRARGSMTLWCLVCLWLLASHAPAQLKPSGAKLEYYRVFYPANLPQAELKELLAGHRPLATAEFEAMLAAVNAAPSGPGGANVRLLEATYTARLDQTDLVAGTAQLQVEHQLVTEAMLGLDPCSLAVSKPRWKHALETTARLGMDAGGKLAVIVEPSVGEDTTSAATAADPATKTAAPPRRATELQFDWTLRGARSSSGALVFDVQTPACPTTRLQLDLPANVTPVVSQGLVSELLDVPPAEEDIDDEDMDADDDSEARRHWLIELGGRTRTTLSIVTKELLEQRQRYVLLRQAVVYDLTAEALEASFDLNLDIYHEPLRQLTLDVDPALRITSVRLGDTPLTWTIAPGVAGSKQRVVIEFSEPLSGHERQLRVATLARVERQQTWRLPGLRVEGVVWQEGSLTLQVPEDLELCALTPHAARQTKATAATTMRTLEQHQFQCVAADAGLDIFVRDRLAKLECEEGLTLKWDGPHLTGRLVSQIMARQGAAYQLGGQLPPGWVVDSVETEPAGALDDWTVVGGAEQESQLTVRLRQPITPQQALQLRVHAHRRAPARNERLQPDEYRLADWQQVKLVRRLIAVQTETQQQLALVGDAGLTRLDPKTLSEAEQRLVDAPASRLVFVEASATPAFALALRSESPRFAAETATTFTLGADVLSESHSIRIVPDATPISRVLVRLTPALTREVTWKLEPSGGADLTARPLATAQGELWELLLPRPQNTPLTITAERQTSLRPGDALREAPLVVVADAETQRGQITIEVADGVSPVVQQQGLKPVLLPAATPSIRARFLHQPAQDQRLMIGHAPTEVRPAPLWAWSRRMMSRVDTTGQRICTVTYYLENTGVPQWTLRLPGGSRLRQTRVNGARLTNLAAPETELAIPLPPGEQYALVEVEYSLPPVSLGLVEELSLPAPTATIPVLAQETQVWLSPDFGLAEDVDRQLDWRSRLLGPLVRRDAGPVSLFSADAWLQPWAGRRANSKQRRWAEHCREAWQQIWSEGPATWGEAVERYDRLAADAPQYLPALEIDAAALARLNVSAETEIAAAERASLAAGFTQHHLALVIHDQTVRLTSRLRAGGAQHERFDAVFTIAVEADANVPPPGLTVTTWLARPELPRWPWLADEPALWTDLEAAGWTAHTLNRQGEEAHFTISRIDDVRAMAWGVFLASAGLCAWLVSRRWFAYLVVVAAAAIVALWLPAALAPLATAAFLGALGGGLAALALRPRRSRRSTHNSTGSAPASSQSRVPVTVGGIILLVGVVWWNGSYAQEPRAAATPQSETYRVLVPTDEEFKPAGDYVYLPRAFYDALARQAKNAKAIPQGWIIYEATYRGRVQTAAAGKLQFADLVASYDVEVFQANTVVTIGLGRENVNLLDDRVNLEGETARIEWLENGAGFTLPIARPGRYRVDVTLRPTARIVGAREEVDLRLPRVARSQLLLRSPMAVPGLQITGALGHSAQAEAGNWSVDLGPTPRLTVYWPTGESTDAPKSEVEVTQQLWWKLREGGVVLESRWQFKSSGDPLSEVRFIADPRLRLLPLAADQPVSEQSVREGDVQAIRFALKEPYQRDVTLTASFSLTGAAGIGRLSLPRLEAVADRTTRRWLAVSTFGALEASVDPAQSPERLTPQEFATAWGAMEPPTQAFRIDEQTQPLVLQVAPLPVQAIARQALTFILEPARVRAELEAVVSVSDGAIYQHQLQLPADWEVDEAELHEGESSPRKLRVAAGQDGAYTLFLPHGVSGEHRLSIKAFGPAAPPEAWTLPAISLRSATGELPVVFVERSGPLVATVTSHAGYEQLADAPPAAAHGPLYRVAVLRPLAGVASRAIEVQAKRSTTRLNATQLISIVRRGDAWQAVVDLALEATGGSVESLRFEIPSDMGEMRLDAPASLQVSAIAGQNRPHLTARLAEPRTGKFTVRLIAPLSASVADRLQAPDIRLLDTESLRTYVVLPAQIDQQKLSWETRGLQAASLPEELREPTPDSIVFQAPTGRFQAAVKRFERVAGVPQVRLADVAVALPTSGHGLGVVSFDLEPAGLAACQLQVPPAQRLIQATVAGRPAMVQPLENNRYRLLLQHEQLSQHIEVLFALSADETDAALSQPLMTPTLVDIPVERTLWTVISDRNAPVYLQNRETLIDLPRQTTFRLKTAEALLAHAASHALEGDAEQIATWFADWSQRQTRLQAMVAREPLDGENQTSALRGDWATLQAEAQTLKQQWNVAELNASAPPLSNSAKQLSDLILIERDGNEHVERAMLPGAPASLAVERTSARAAFVLPRALGALLVVLSFCAVTMLLRWPACHDFVKQSPQLIGVALGIAWWFWLTPPMVGIAMAVIFAAAALRSPWPRTPAISSSLLSSPSTGPRAR